jgi:hypothetical protein
MTEDLIGVTERLNEVLTEENALLDALDLSAAVALLPRKRDAVEALQAMVSDGTATAELSAEDTERFRESLQRLATLGAANRTAIEHGLALQMRVIQTIAQAVPRALALEAPIYQPDGRQMPPRPPEAYAFLSRM